MMAHMETFMKMHNLIVQIEGAILMPKYPYKMRFNVCFPRVVPFSQGKFHAPNQGYYPGRIVTSG